MPQRPSTFPSPRWSLWLTVGALCWVICFSVWFSRFDLPNNRPATRLDLWQVVPFHLLDLIDPPEDANAPPSGWSYLPQRFPAWGLTAALLASAYGWGILLLRKMQLPFEDDLPSRLFLGTMLGLMATSLFTLGCGLAGLLAWILFFVWTLCGLAIGAWQESKLGFRIRSRQLKIPRTAILAFIATAPFLLVILLGSVTPQNDFDVREYHLQGPKEYFQNGRISFLPHNIYTSFPSLTEMLVLASMVLMDDWQAGATAGQPVLAMFAPLTAVGVFAAGRKWFSEVAGYASAIIFLSTPWTVRISIIAYAEGGLSAYLFATIYVTLALCQAFINRQTHAGWGLLVGCLAGSAMACKYPGLISAIAPAGLMIAATLIGRLRPDRTFSLKVSDPITTPPDLTRSRKQEIVLLALGGLLGLSLAIGPWLAKNLFETGNPVYPLAYSIFGGADLDEALAEKWSHGHSPPVYPSVTARVRDLFVKLVDFTGNNDWHSALLFAFAPLAILQPRHRSLIMGLFAWLAWLFLTWWLLTHHIDRFWVPMIPLAALLAGIGATWSTNPLWRYFTVAVGLLWMSFNLTIATSGYGGYNVWLSDLDHARKSVTRIYTPEIALLNEAVQGMSPERPLRVLSVGEAAVFDAQFPIFYNTVFDRSLFEEWLGEPGSGTTGSDRPFRDAAEMRKILAEKGVTHVLVNWREILRYREPGSYGYTDFVHPQRFRALQELGILSPSLPTYQQHTPLTDDRRKLLQDWAPELIDSTSPDQPTYLSGQVFEVR